MLNILLVLLVKASNRNGVSIKQNAGGYKEQAEVLASLVLEFSTLDCSKYVVYQPCIIQLTGGDLLDGCYFLDFCGTKQEVTLKRLFEANIISTDPITNNKTLSTSEKFEQLIASNGRTVYRS